MSSAMAREAHRTVAVSMAKAEVLRICISDMVRFPRADKYRTQPTPDFQRISCSRPAVHAKYFSFDRSLNARGAALTSQSATVQFRQSSAGLLDIRYALEKT